jgi:hypothetical protein
MITANPKPTAHVGEDRSSPAAAAQQYWFTNFPEYDAKSVAELVVANERDGFAMRVGDAVYVTEIRRHILTDADLDAAARVAIAAADAIERDTRTVDMFEVQQ